VPRLFLGVLLPLLVAGATLPVRLNAGERALSMTADAWSQRSLGGIDHEVFALALGAASCHCRER
jgi:hypothetical protein